MCQIENRVDAATEMGSNSPGHPRPPIAKATTEITGKWQLPTIESKRNLEHDEKMQTMLQPYHDSTDLGKNMQLWDRRLSTTFFDFLTAGSSESKWQWYCPECKMGVEVAQKTDLKPMPFAPINFRAPQWPQRKKL